MFFFFFTKKMPKWVKFSSMDEKTECFDEIFVCGRKNDGREMITRCRFRVIAGLYGGFSRLFGWSLRPLCPKKQ